MKKKTILLRKLFDENTWLMSAVAKRLWVKPPTVCVTASWKKKTRLETKKRYAKALNEELWTDYGFIELFEEVKKSRRRQTKK